MLTANVLPTSFCACCLIAEPPSPRPRDPPGSMYHLLCHRSFSFFLLFALLLSSPFISLFFMSVCLFCALYITAHTSHPSICHRAAHLQRLKNSSNTRASASGGISSAFSRSRTRDGDSHWRLELKPHLHSLGI